MYYVWRGGGNKRRAVGTSVTTYIGGKTETEVGISNNNKQINW